jgi:hypothetical protein
VNIVMEIEAAPPQSGTLYFAPLQRSVRGEIRLGDCPEADKSVERAWPKVIPGQVIGLTAEGKGYILDPLHRPDHEPLRAQMKAEKLALGTKPDEVFNADKPTWLYWMRRCIESGNARLTKGQLPDAAACKGAKKDFGAPAPVNPERKRADVILSLLVAKLPPAERKAYESALDELADED